MARAGALFIARCEQNVCRRMCAPCSIPRDALSATDGFDHAVARDGRPVRQAQHAPAPEMTSGLQGRRQSLRQQQLT